MKIFKHTDILKPFSSKCPICDNNELYCNEACTFTDGCIRRIVWCGRGHDFQEHESKDVHFIAFNPLLKLNT